MIKNFDDVFILVNLWHVYMARLKFLTQTILTSPLAPVITWYAQNYQVNITINDCTFLVRCIRKLTRWPPSASSNERGLVQYTHWDPASYVRLMRNERCSSSNKNQDFETNFQVRQIHFTWKIGATLSSSSPLLLPVSSLCPIS